MRRTSALFTVAASFLIGCAESPPELPEWVGEAETEIINGTPDTTHDAVVLLLGQFSGCTGTIIATSGSDAFILTAAHCFQQDTIQQARVGANGLAPQAVLTVMDWESHPQFNPNDLAYDFAMIRATGASGLPVIPALGELEDTLAPGTPVIHVGYGLLSSPDGDTDRRHFANGTLDQVAGIQISYNQPNTGPCSGDSGGPNIVDLGQGKRVAGVISYGDETCSSFGVSGRVSAVMPWINEFMGNAPGPSAASTTAPAATTSSASTGTGMGGNMTGGATTATGSTGTGFVAGDAEPHDYEGDVVSSGACSASLLAVNGEGRWAALGVLALGLLWSRRRSATSRV